MHINPLMLPFFVFLRVSMPCLCRVCFGFCTLISRAHFFFVTKKYALDTGFDASIQKNTCLIAKNASTGRKNRLTI